ncbi:MAG TPA: class I SAM-dependent methyltransferase [Polyangia bacterium]|nr:class I SAM-dependent methyltransferase [Polyangia bacterium]
MSGGGGEHGGTGASVPSAALYAALAAVYDRWQASDGTPFSHLALAQLEPALARHRRATSVASFVDLGCGTGELLLALRARHPNWRLCGVDASAEMLAVARAKTNAAGIAWRASALERADQALGTERFDTAGAFYDTLNHLPDRAALARAFRAVARLLVPGGLFVFDVTNALGFRRWWTGNRTWRGAGWQVRVEMAYHPAASDAEAAATGSTGTGLADVTVIEEKGIARRAAIAERCFADPVIRSTLAEAGLRVESVRSWAPFDIDAEGKTLFFAIKESNASELTMRTLR